MAIDVIGRVEEEWRSCFAELARGEFLRSLETGGFTASHYRGFLRETYHNVAMNPRIGCLFLGRLSTSKPSLEARLLKHVAAEIGHDRLALADLAALGEDPEAVRRGRPLPTTEALAAFIAFQIAHRHPLAYFGYVYHLEAIAEAIGTSSMGCLSSLGIPPGAMSFLREHADNDPVHMRFNREYLQGFVRDEEGLEAVLYGLRGTCRLHGVMFQGIVEEERERSTGWIPGAPLEKPAKA